MDYSQKTQDLLNRMCRNVERLDFELDKPLAEELILKTYDLFNLKRPAKIEWLQDLEDKKYIDVLERVSSAWSAWRAISAISAWSASSASVLSSTSAMIVLSATSANARSSRSSTSASAWSAMRAWRATSASVLSSTSAMIVLSATSANARSTTSAMSVLSATSTLDYDFNWYIYGFEYYQNPEKNQPPNENDKKYLEYCELLMQAKEAGLGYRLEWEDTLYLVPTPIVHLNELNQFHSDKVPAIRWKGGAEYFFLNGVSFPKDLWKKVTSGTMPFEDILKIEDVDQRTQAMRYGDVTKFIEHAKAELLDEYNKFTVEGEPVNYKLYRFPKGDIFTEDAYYCLFDCPSTRKKHMEGVEKSKTVPEAMSWAEEISEEDWKLRVPLLHEV